MQYFPLIEEVSRYKSRSTKDTHQRTFKAWQIEVSLLREQRPLEMKPKWPYASTRGAQWWVILRDAVSLALWITYHEREARYFRLRGFVNGSVESPQRLLLAVIHLRVYSRHAEIVEKFSHLRLPPETCRPNWRDGARKFTLPLIYIPARLFTGLSFSPKGTRFPEVDELARSTPRLLRMVLLTTSVHASCI